MTRDIILCLNITKLNTSLQKKVKRAFSDARLFQITFTNYLAGFDFFAVQLNILEKNLIIAYELDIDRTEEQLWTIKDTGDHLFPDDLEILEFIHGSGKD